MAKNENDAGGAGAGQAPPDNQDLTIVLSLGAGAVASGLTVERVLLIEQLSRAYECRLTFVATAAITLSTVLGEAVSLRVTTRAGEQIIKGVLSELTLVDQTAALGYLYRAVVRPKFSLCALNGQNRIYGTDQPVSTADLITTKLNANGVTFSNSFVRTDHPQRDFVVQYNESDFDFLARTCEHHGVFFFFALEGADRTETVIFGDSNTAFKELSLAGTGKQVTYRRNQPLDFSTSPYVTTFGYEAKPVPTAVKLRDYNPDNSAADLLVNKQVTNGKTGTYSEYGAHYSDDTRDGAFFADIRMQEIACTRQVFRGTSNIPNLRPGYIIKLVDHPSLDGEYVVTSVEHEVESPSPSGFGDGTVGGKAFSNSFTCISAAKDSTGEFLVSFRPERTTRRPVAAGVFTAIVDTSEDGVRADVDARGRYKLRLNYDDGSTAAGSRSNYVRKADPYTGKDDTGMHFPLRKGTEVVLACLNGDIDRPIIVGAVPNNQTMPVARQNNETINRIRTPSGASFEMDDGTGGTLTSPVFLPQLRLATPRASVPAAATSTATTTATSTANWTGNLTDGTYLRLGVYKAAEELPLLTGLTYTKSTASASGNPEPTADLFTVNHFVDTAEDANEQSVNASKEAWEQSFLIPQANAEDANGNPRPGYTLYATSPATASPPNTRYYLPPNIRVEGDRLIKNRAASQMELQSISIATGPQTTPSHDGFLARTDKDMEINVAGATVMMIGKGRTEKIVDGDARLDVQQGIIHMKATQGIAMYAGTPDKPANIALTAYGYIKQEAKGPVSDYFYSTQERKVYGYSREWFYGEKYSEHHGTDNKLFFGATSSLTMGVAQTTFIGARLQFNLSGDVAIKAAAEARFNLAAVFSLSLSAELTVGFGTKTSFFTGLATSTFTGVKTDFIIGTDTKTVTGASTSTITGPATKTVIGVDTANIFGSAVKFNTGADLKKASIDLKVVEVDAKIAKFEVKGANLSAFKRDLDAKNTGMSAEVLAALKVLM